MKRRNEILVGIVIILGLAVGVFGSLWMQGRRFARNTIFVEALFSNVGQLLNGAPVKLRGVGIGQVTDITVEPNGNAVRIRLAVTRGVQIPDDAAVIVAPESMFGDWQVEVVARSAYPQFAFYESTDPEALGGFTIPDLSRLTATADRIAENLATITDRVSVAFTEATASNIAQAINNIGEVSERLAQLVETQADVVDEVVVDVQTSAAEVAAAARSARSTLDQLDRVLSTGAVDSIIVDTRFAAKEFGGLVADLRTTVSGLETTLALADSTFGRFNRIGTRMEAGEGSLGRLLADSTLAVRAEEALTQLTLLLADFRENPNRYVRLSIF